MLNDNKMTFTKLIQTNFKEFKKNITESEWTTAKNPQIALWIKDNKSDYEMVRNLALQDLCEEEKQKLESDSNCVQKQNTKLQKLAGKDLEITDVEERTK